MSKNNNEKSGKRGVIEYLTVKTELPSDILSGSFRLEIRGRNQMYLHGCRRIIKYSPDEMILSSADFSVIIRGCRLICSAYYGGTVCIEGMIDGFEFDEGGRK